MKRAVLWSIGVPLIAIGILACFIEGPDEGSGYALLGTPMVLLGCIFFVVGLVTAGPGKEGRSRDEGSPYTEFHTCPGCGCRVPDPADGAGRSRIERHHEGPVVGGISMFNGSDDDTGGAGPMGAFLVGILAAAFGSLLCIGAAVISLVSLGAVLLSRMLEWLADRT